MPSEVSREHVIRRFHEAEADARLPLHVCGGSIKLNTDDTESIECRVEFLMPIAGPTLVLLHGTGGDLPSRGFAFDLAGSGDGPNGSFSLRGPVVSIRETSAAFAEQPWVLGAQVNEPFRVDYGEPRPAGQVEVLLNNFDFDSGNERGHDGAPILKVNAGGREVVFKWSVNRPDLHLRASALGLRSASFSTFSFAAWPGASDDELLSFSLDVTGLCTFAVGQLIGGPLITFNDAKGRVIRRILRQPVTSRYQKDSVIPMPWEFGSLFESCFEEFVRLKSAREDWAKLGSYVGAMDQCQFLEQKFASVMMGIEFLAKQCLFNVTGRPFEELEKLAFPDVMSRARSELAWDIPKHYKVNDLARLLRNAVAHGGQLPTGGNDDFRRLYDKWRLFFLRRVLIRLGYKGKVVSPHKGWEATSDVDNFSEEHNSFEVPPGALAESKKLWAFFKKLKA